MPFFIARVAGIFGAVFGSTTFALRVLVDPMAQAGLVVTVGSLAVLISIAGWSE